MIRPHPAEIIYSLEHDAELWASVPPEQRSLGNRKRGWTRAAAEKVLQQQMEWVLQKLKRYSSVHRCLLEARPGMLSQSFVALSSLQLAAACGRGRV